MTEEQIIKGLNDTVGKEHIGIYCTDKNGNFTTVIKLTDIVDFINRQKSTIDELTKAYKSLKSEKNAEIEQKDIEIKLLIEKKESAYDEISRLNAVLERLQGINEILEAAFITECDLSNCPRKKEIRDEAIKEFWKRLWEKAYKIHGFEVIDVEDGDNLAKEMEGESE